MHLTPHKLSYFRDGKMSKKSSEKKINDQESAFELIELAIDDIEVLTKAFHMVSKICEGLDRDAEDREQELKSVPDSLVH